MNIIHHGHPTEPTKYLHPSLSSFHHLPDYFARSLSLKLCLNNISSLYSSPEYVCSTMSGPPDPTDASDALAANGTMVHLPRALLTSHHMPAIVEHGIYLVLVAYLTDLHLLVRHLEPHRTLPVPPTLLPSALVHIVGRVVRHRAVTLALVGRKGADIRVSIRVSHSALPGAGTGDEIAGVDVARRGDYCAQAMNETVAQADGLIFCRAERTVGVVRDEIAWVVIVAEIGEEADRVGVFAFGYKLFRPESTRICQSSFHLKGLGRIALVTYSSAVGRRCAMYTQPSRGSCASNVRPERIRSSSWMHRELS